MVHIFVNHRCFQSSVSSFSKQMFCLWSEKKRASEKVSNIFVPWWQFLLDTELWDIIMSVPWGRILKFGLSMDLPLTISKWTYQYTKFSRYLDGPIYIHVTCNWNITISTINHINFTLLSFEPWLKWSQHKRILLVPFTHVWFGNQEVAWSLCWWIA